MELPERINVVKVVSYDTDRVVKEMIESGIKEETIDIDALVDYIEPWVLQDLSCGYGHEADLGELIYQDQNGEILY